MFFVPLDLVYFIHFNRNIRFKNTFAIKLLVKIEKITSRIIEKIKKKDFYSSLYLFVKY